MTLEELDAQYKIFKNFDDKFDQMRDEFINNHQTVMGLTSKHEIEIKEARKATDLILKNMETLIEKQNIAIDEMRKSIDLLNQWRYKLIGAVVAITILGSIATIVIDHYDVFKGSTKTVSAKP